MSLFTPLQQYFSPCQPVAAAGEETPAETAATAFTYADLEAKARELATENFAESAREPSQVLHSLSREQWDSLSYQSETGEAWNDDGRFHLRFRIPGFIFHKTVKINLVDEAGVRPMPYQPERLRSEDKELLEQLRDLRPGFTGFELAAIDGKGFHRQLGLLYASHFLFSGRNARPGIFSMPALPDPGIPSGASPSFFREFWLHRPDENGVLTVHALMDSQVMTGAFEFIITPGTSSIVDVRAGFFPRSPGAAQPRTGFAPIMGMFLFSESSPTPDDYRPEVHNCDGLLVSSGENDWHWTPLKNPERLATSEFPVTAPKGFGLVQRDERFDHYQDLQNRFEQSTSVWIEPSGNWGSGSIGLMEIPGTKDYHFNIIAYWLPNGNAAAAGENENDRGKTPFSLAYRMYWMPPGTKLHELGMVRDVHMERSRDDGTVTFLVDFEGENLRSLPPDTGLTSVVEHPKEIDLREKQLIKNEVTGGWRLIMKFAPPKSGMLDSLLAARNGQTQFPVAAYLKKGENLDEVLTETWRYNVIP